MDELLKSTFSNEAEEYDNITQYLLLDYDYILDQAVQKIDFKKDDYFCILDLGCGTGNLTKRIRLKFPNATIYALDFSTEMINVAKQKMISDIQYISANMFDMKDLSLPYFDVVISSFVFHNFHSLNEHENIYSLLCEHLSVNGKIIIADLIELEDCYQKKDVQKKLVDLMHCHNLSNSEIVKWLGVLEIEDSPLPIYKQIELLKKCGFDLVNINTFSQNNIAIFTATKKLVSIQLKSELLFYGVKSNCLAKKIYQSQNPQNIWKTGNNGVFVTINGLDMLISINHAINNKSPYKFIEDRTGIVLTKYDVKIDVAIMPLKFPEWFFERIPELDNRPFSEFFVYEGQGFLHLAYKSCSFSNEEKCKFCSTQRRTLSSDNTADEICKALSHMISKIPENTHICLGGGSYFPIEDNVDYFSSIIKCIRKYSCKIPIWVEMIPPKIQDVERLIEDGATAFGFNIEIWNDSIRQKICPGKSAFSKEYYIEACRFVLKKLGPNSVGTCIVAGLDSYENIKEAIDFLVAEGIEPCILPYKTYNKTNLGEYKISLSYRHDFYRLSKYVALTAKKMNVIFDQNQGCLKCSCCTLMHDFQNELL